MYCKFISSDAYYLIHILIRIFNMKNVSIGKDNFSFLKHKITAF